MKLKKKDIVAVIVTFNPDIEKLLYNLKYIQKNFIKIIIVNNSKKYLFNKISKKIICIENKKNLGLAKGQNIGIKKAIRLNYKAVCLLDQDTLIDKKFLKSMIYFINKYGDRNKVSSFSPVYKNVVTNQNAKNIIFKFLGFTRVDPKKIKSNYLKVTYSIASGTIIETDKIKKIGYMLEKLFIDFVDIEWHLRANYKGFQNISLQKVKIKQELGDYKKRIFNRVYSIHSPLRMYYYFRNSVYLYKKKYVEINWVLTDLFRNFFRFLFFILFVRNKLTYLKNIINGIFDGLRNKMGKLN